MIEKSTTASSTNKIHPNEPPVFVRESGWAVRPASGLRQSVDQEADPGVPVLSGSTCRLLVARLRGLVDVAVELGGGMLLVLGYRARLAALALAVFSLAAAVSFHSNFADQNQMIHFLKNVMMAGGLLQIAAFGAGAISIEQYRRKGGTPSAGAAMDARSARARARAATQG